MDAGGGGNNYFSNFIFFGFVFASRIAKVEGQHAAGEPLFAPLLRTKVWEEISYHRVNAFLSGCEVRSQCVGKLMTVLQTYAQQLCVL